MSSFPMRWSQNLCAKKSFSLSVTVNWNRALEEPPSSNVSPPARPIDHSSAFCDGITANSKPWSYCKKCLLKESQFINSVYKAQWEFNQGTFLSTSGSRGLLLCGQICAQRGLWQSLRAAESQGPLVAAPLSQWPIHWDVSPLERRSEKGKNLKYKDGNAKDKGKLGVQIPAFHKPQVWG